MPAGISIWAQTWEMVKADAQTFIFGEGWGETVDEADKQALSSLVSKISIVVSSNFEMLEGESKTAVGDDYNRYIENKISTYANATLTNTELYIISNEPDAHVARWIKRTELDRIFEGRRSKVLEYVQNAERGESLGKVDDALRNYYWAYCLLKTLQHPSELKYKDAFGQSHLLVTWIPEKMDGIFDDIRPSVIDRDGDNLNIYFSFRGKPVASLDYTYFDGSHWSNIYSAKDGKGVLELAPGALGETIQIKYEYAYKNEAHIDKELYSVISVVKGNAMRASYDTINGGINKNMAQVAENETKESVKELSEALPASYDENKVRESVDRVVKAISTKQYAAAYQCFTDEGLDIYKRIIAYGNAALVGRPSYSIYRNGDNTVVRSITMSFSFEKGLRKSFVEDIVFTFNDEGLIDCLAFALDEKAMKDILKKQAWPENSRMSIVEFLENYKTAFALKRLDYIRTIFDDNAVIIVGKVARVSNSYSGDSINLPQNNRIVTRTRYNKQQYIKHLEACFASKEFVNIRFSNNDVVKAGKGGEVYGIQIKQDYYSNNYGDTGYLFLLVDMNKPSEPMIKVRTWQQEPDPVDGLFDISSFD